MLKGSGSLRTNFIFIDEKEDKREYACIMQIAEISQVVYLDASNALQGMHSSVPMGDGEASWKSKFDGCGWKSRSVSRVVEQETFQKRRCDGEHIQYHHDTDLAEVMAATSQSTKPQGQPTRSTATQKSGTRCRQQQTEREARKRYS